MRLGEVPALRMETRAKWQIPNELRSERHKEALDAAVELHRAAHPNAVLRSITAVYNCVGMVLSSRRAWVDTEHIRRILREDGFRRLTDSSEAECGDVVIYHDDEGEACHMGLIAHKKIIQGQDEDHLRVLSKWGSDGEYFHDLSDVPLLLGRPAEFWTDRRNV